MVLAWAGEHFWPSIHFTRQRRFSTAQTYKRIVEKLTELGFNHHQYSDYCNLDTDALSAWDAMAQIGRLPPPSKIATTLKGMGCQFCGNIPLTIP